MKFEQFKKTGQGYEFSETFAHQGVHCEFKALVHSNNMYSIFSIDKKTFRIKGGKDHFGIFIRRPDTKLPLSLHIEEGNVECWLKVIGGRLYYDDGQHKNKNQKKPKQQSKVSKIRPAERNTPEIKCKRSAAPSAWWAIQHPYQGGSMSSK